MMGETTVVALPYIRIQCPICWQFSPWCDQREDIHRDALSKWYGKHWNDHKPFPIHFAAEEPT